MLVLMFTGGFVATERAINFKIVLVLSRRSDDFHTLRQMIWKSSDLQSSDLLLLKTKTILKYYSLCSNKASREHENKHRRFSIRKDPIKFKSKDSELKFLWL